MTSLARPAPAVVGGLAAIALAALLLALAGASPARAATISSVTPNPATAGAELTVVAECSDYSITDGVTIQYSHLRSDGTVVNFHYNYPDVTGFVAGQDIVDSYVTSGITSPGMEDGDYYWVTVICDIGGTDDTAFDIAESGMIPITLDDAEPSDPADPGDDSSENDDNSEENDGVSFRTGVESPGSGTDALLATAGIVVAVVGAAILVIGRSRRRLRLR